MNNNTFQKKIWALAIIIPLLVVWGGSAFASIVTTVPFNFMEELGPRLQQTVTAAIPFIVLIFVNFLKVQKEGNSALRGSNLALTLITIGTLIFWGYFWFVGISYQLSDGSGGANIGLAILMFISPLIIAILIPVGLYFGKGK